MKNINEYLNESILDDEEELVNDNTIEKDFIKNILNTFAHFELNGKNIKVLHANSVSPTSEFVALNNYIFENIPSFEVGTDITIKNDDISTKYIDTTDLLNPTILKQWPHIKHIGKMFIYINDNKNELDLTNLKVDNIDELIIRVKKARPMYIKIKGPKNTEIKQVKIEALSYTNIRPSLITGFNCRRMVLYGILDSVTGVRADTIKSADIYDPSEFDKLEEYNDIDSFIVYNTKLKTKEIFYILYKDGGEWISKKSAMQF